MPSRSIATAPGIVCAAVKLPSRLAEKHATKAKQRASKQQTAEPNGAQAFVKAGINSDKKKPKHVPLQQVFNDDMRRARSNCQHADMCLL